MPAVVVMENVGGVAHHGDGGRRPIDEILDRFRTMGYRGECDFFNSADYALPHYRHRVHVASMSCIVCKILIIRYH